MLPLQFIPRANNTHSVIGVYRYGFQGQEADDELRGKGNSVNYKYRMHDARIGRFFATDPLEKKYPYLTPYQFSSNQPIHARELEGLEEYQSYQSYVADMGCDAACSEEELDGTDGVWFTKDRTEQNSRWKNAMEYITKNEANNMLNYVASDGRGGVGIDRYSFKIVRDYYLWVQTEVENKGYGSQWAKGAAYLVHELADTYEMGDPGTLPGVATGNMMFAGLKQLLTDLNQGIFAFATTRFNSILYGSEGESVDDWYEWDYNFVFNEQKNGPAYRVYLRYSGTTKLKLFNQLSSGSGIFAIVMTKHYFPDFSRFGADLTDPNTDWATDQRVNIPMLMLYPERHSFHVNVGEIGLFQVKTANRMLNSYFDKNKIK